MGLSRHSWSAMPSARAERYRETPVDAVIFDTDGLGDAAVDALDRHAR